MKAQALLLGTSLMFAMASGAEDITISAARVNLRARPVADSEVVAQAGPGDILTVVRAEADWLAVRAPTNASVWVKGEFVKDGLVLSERLNIRCGPGLSYRDLGVVRKGDRLAITEIRGGWLRIVPPDALVVWVSRSVVAPVDAGHPVTAAESVTTGSVAGAVAEDSAPAVIVQNDSGSRLPVDMTQDQLAPVLGQGAVIERVGVLERVPLAFVRGVEFRLVDHAAGRKTTIGYVRGDDPQIVPRLGQRCTVKGRGYWLNGERVPLIYADLLAVAVDVP
jgi:SH3-like domain-containing protein